MNRIPPLVLGVAIGAILGLLNFSASYGQVPVSTSQSRATIGNQGRQISLRDQLRVGLKARTRSDFAFIDRVVARVDQRRLPRRLVDGTFLWARKRAQFRSGSRQLRPMIYFRPALTLRARRLGIVL